MKIRKTGEQLFRWTPVQTKKRTVKLLRKVCDLLHLVIVEIPAQKVTCNINSMALCLEHSFNILKCNTRFLFLFIELIFLFFSFLFVIA